MKRSFNKAVRQEMKRVSIRHHELLEEKDIAHLPGIVQKYIRNAGFVGKEKVLNFRAEFRGGIRFKPGEDMMKLHSLQYNFLDHPARLFYIKAKKMGIPAVGLHLYREAKAIFKIRLIGLIPVVDASGQKMDQGETVTVFNDTCFLAPGSLIDPRITWSQIDETTIKAVFTNESITISAVLYFNAEGNLIDFLSYDRFETNGREYVNNPWRTPVVSYAEFKGYRLPQKARLIYVRPDGEFCYGEFELKNIQYNCTKFR